MKKKAQPQEKPIAHLTIRGSVDMSLVEKKKIAAWLRLRANDIIFEGDRYAKNFSAKYFK